MSEPRLLTAEQAAPLLGCSAHTLKRERTRGDGCPYVKMRRKVFYRPEDIAEFIASRVRRSTTARLEASAI